MILESYIQYMIKPDACFDRITDIDIGFLEEHNIKGIILDVDNTILDLDKNPLDGIDEWIKRIKLNKIKLCIASNSANTVKLENISKRLDIPYIGKSLKPLKNGLKKAIDILKLDKKNIAEIGDQLFTDVWGSNRLGLFSILVKPISKEKHILGEFRRKIERSILNKRRD